MTAGADDHLKRLEEDFNGGDPFDLAPFQECLDYMAALRFNQNDALEGCLVCDTIHKGYVMDYLLSEDSVSPLLLHCPLPTYILLNHLNKQPPWLTGTLTNSTTKHPRLAHPNILFSSHPHPPTNKQKQRKRQDDTRKGSKNAKRKK